MCVRSLGQTNNFSYVSAHFLSSFFHLSYLDAPIYLWYRLDVWPDSLGPVSEKMMILCLCIVFFFLVFCLIVFCWFGLVVLRVFYALIFTNRYCLNASMIHAYGMCFRIVCVCVWKREVQEMRSPFSFQNTLLHTSKSFEYEPETNTHTHTHTHYRFGGFGFSYSEYKL